MVAKFWVAALAAGVIGAVALSAPSSYAQTSQPAAKPAATNPAAKKPAAAKPAAAKPAAAQPATGDKPAAHHKMSCYDYAWQSQQMQDCLAKSSGKQPAAQKTSTTTKKPAGKAKTKGKQQS